MKGRTPGVNAVQDSRPAGEFNMKQMELLVCGLILMLVSVPAIAQEVAAEPVEVEAEVVVAVEPAPMDAAAIEAKIKALKTEQDEAEDKLDDLRSKIAKSDAVADLRKAAADAEKAYQDKKLNDETVIAAKKADRDASAALKAAVLAKVKSSVDGEAILKEIADQEEKRDALDLQAAIAELKLTHKASPVARALAADPVIKEFYATYQAAKKGPARDKARKNYYDVKKTALEKLPEAKALMDEIKAAEKGMDDAENAVDAAEDKLDKLYDTAADSDDQDIVVAKAKRDAARKAYQEAYYGGAMQAARDARSTTKKALSAKVKALAAQDPAASELATKIDTLDKAIDELKAKARELRKKNSE